MSVLKTKGIEDIQGVEGAWLTRDCLQIPQELLITHDLKNPIDLGRKFDLAISLEVVEHLPESSAKDFIASLVNLSDHVLFSAAIPHQGGVGHVNLQWIDYWDSLFREHGYIGVDIVRRRIWDDKNIPTWYKQNTVLFVKENRFSELKLKPEDYDFNPVSLVHPEAYLKKLSKSTSVTVRGSWGLFHKALRKWFLTKIRVIK